MNLKKLKEQSPKIHRSAIIEELQNIPISFYDFTNNDVSNYSLNEIKTRTTAEVSPRVLSNWIKKEVVHVDSSDMGKVNRFNRLESIWLNLVVDLRKFGLPLQALKYIREQLFNYTIEGFSMFKFKVLKIILDSPEYLVINEDYQVGFYSYELYANQAKKGNLLPHLALRFEDYIKEEFPDNSIHLKFNINDIEKDVEKVSLLYYLRTNDFNDMLITLNSGEKVSISNSKEIKENKQLLQSIENWSFKSIEIKINEGAEFLINN